MKKMNKKKTGTLASSGLVPVILFYIIGLLIVCRCAQLSYRFGDDLFSGGLSEAGERIMAFVRMIRRWIG